MNFKRLVSAFLNIVLGLVNIIFWIIGMSPIGQIIFDTYLPKGRFQQFIFGLITILVYGSMIGFVITIILWVLDKPSPSEVICRAIFN